MISLGAELGTASGFAACAYGGTFASAAVCRGVTPFVDGPRVGRPPVTLLLAAAAVVGSIVALHGVSVLQAVFSALLVGTLVACTYSDIACGIVPDRFTLVPLALVAGWCAIDRNTGPLVAAAVVAGPFGMAAFLSKGLGMGWGDVKLAALVGAVVGIAPAIVAFACACALAGVIAIARGRTREPVALVPYLASFASVALMWSP